MSHLRRNRSPLLSAMFPLLSLTPTPSITEQYDELVAAIVKSRHPNAICNGSMWFSKEGGDGLCLNPDASTLEDVLWALMHHSDKRVIAVDYFGNWIRFKEWDGKSQNKWEFLDNDARWQPGKPLSDQSDECKKFLHSLLVP